MSKNEKTLSRRGLASSRTRRVTLVGVFAAIATVLMFFELPLPFMPPFLKLDPSGVPILLASMVLGPGGAIGTALIKDLVHVLSSSTGGVGELADFLLTASFALVVGFLYRKNPNRQGVALATLAGTLTCGLVGALANYFLLIPFYAKVTPLEAIFAACAKVNPAINGMGAYIAFGVVPFNLIKGLVISLLTFLLYRKLEGFLKSYIRP